MAVIFLTELFKTLYAAVVLLFLVRHGIWLWVCLP